MKKYACLVLFAVFCGFGAVSFAQDATDTAAEPVVTEPAATEPVVESKPAEDAGVWADMFPDGLIDSSGSPVSAGTLSGKIVGMYFSAHWCPPCRAFSPSLVQFRDANTDEFEVVFVSSDKSPEAQLEYMKEVGMNWPAVQHGSEVSQKLKEKYEVVGIPMLVILGPNGEIISKSGRNEVANSPDSCLENWKAAAKK